MDVVASITERVGDVGGYLREQRELARLSVRQLASLAGVSNPYLSQVERGLRNPSAEVLSQIAKGLRISAGALYVRAGILDQEDRPDVEVAIATDPALTDRQRRVLLDIYATFRSENDRSDDDVLAGNPATTRPASNGSVTTSRAATRATRPEPATGQQPPEKPRPTRGATPTKGATPTQRATPTKGATPTKRAGSAKRVTSPERVDESASARTASARTESATPRTTSSRARSSR